MSDVAAQRLIWAIVEQACHDYLFYKRKLKIYPRDTEYTREFNSTVNFFRSKWWDCLMPNIVGETVIKKLEDILNKGEYEDVCEQQICESLEDLPQGESGSEVYGYSDFYQP